MENSIPGIVAEIIVGFEISRLKLALAGGDVLEAEIPNAEMQHLNLHPGSHVTATIRSPWVTHDAAIFSHSGRNLLTGTINKLEEVAGTTKVTARLNGDDSITSTMDADYARTLGFSVGSTVTIIIKASHITLSLVS